MHKIRQNRKLRRSFAPATTSMSHVEAALRFVIEVGGAWGEAGGPDDHRGGHTWYDQLTDCIMVGAPEADARRAGSVSNGHFPFYHTDINEVMSAITDWARAVGLSVMVDMTAQHVVIALREGDTVLADVAGPDMCHVLLEASVLAHRVLEHGTQAYTGHVHHAARVARLKALLGRDRNDSNIPPPSMRAEECKGAREEHFDVLTMQQQVPLDGLRLEVQEQARQAQAQAVNLASLYLEATSHRDEAIRQSELQRAADLAVRLGVPLNSLVPVTAAISTSGSMTPAAETTAHETEGNT